MLLSVTPRIGSLPALVAPPGISDITTVGQTSTATPGAYTGSPTVARQWMADGVAIGGATGTSFTATVAQAGSVLTLRETATNAFGSVVSFSNAVGPIQGTGGLTASFGTMTPAGTGGWQPRRGNGAVDALSGVSIASGSPGAVPSIAGGRLVWSAPLTPGATGTVLSLTATSGASYTATVAVLPNRIDLAQTSDLSPLGAGASLAGKTVVFRQNAQAVLGSLFSNAGNALAAYDASPPTVVGEGVWMPGEFHIAPTGTIATPKAIRFQGLKLQQGTGFTFVNTGNPRLVEIEGCHFSNLYLDKSNPAVLSSLQTGGYTSVVGNTRRGVLTNSGDIDALIVRDCTFEDCFLPLEITAGWYLEISGCRFLRTYFDGIKNSSRTALTLLGGNAFIKPTGRPKAAAGGYNDDPHHDAIQHTGVGVNSTHPWEMHMEANVFSEGDGEQANSLFFMADTKTGTTVGRRTVAIGNGVYMDGSYPFASDAPDRNLYAYNLSIQKRRTSFPLTKGTPLAARWSRTKTGDNYFWGDITRRNNLDPGFVNGTGAVMNASNDLDLDTLTSLAAYQAAFPKFQVDIDPEPTWWEVFATYETAGVAAGKGPWAVVTPGAARQSDYAISTSAFPNPVLSGLSITPTAGGFTASVTTDNPYPRVMWAATTTAAPLTADQIRRLDPRIVASGKTIPGATATLPAAIALSGSGLTGGTPHWLHVYQPFGKRGSAVLTQAFTPA